jgi:dTDP-4-dehydrorhamnose reductase
MQLANRLPLLITGIAGVSGYNAFAYFRSKYGDQVIGQRPKNNWPLSGPGIVGIDLEDETRIAELVEEHGFRSVINCGGSCALKSCELDPVMARRVNVSGIEALLKAMKNKPIRFVHLSIDLVYSGTANGSHVESDPPDPVTVYGKTMVQAEELILSERPESCVARISLPMGISFNGHAGAIDWIQHRFASDKPATLYFDEVRTPTYVECLNEVGERLLSGNQSGLFHAGGTRKLSLYQIAQIVNRVGGYDPDLLQGCPRIDAGPMPPRAGNVTMNSTRLGEALGCEPFLPWPFHSEHVPSDRSWHYERGLFDGSPELLRESLYLRPNPGTPAEKDEANKQ